MSKFQVDSATKFIKKKLQEKTFKVGTRPKKFKKIMFWGFLGPKT